eukprot:CAMPEP_0197585630 /NCGR_PEP_ID=MMETSP1326-20131121/7869_1 /TAXON_ID=1155430 /ORGANISM="Genus nov. species nov., Strain RCC2288" /LENGTH=531 /DNA_ID=CAMNT_0043150161 /DNA_START=439 /DNA_END=2034 /DNA_ORIENTATION=+
MAYAYWRNEAHLRTASFDLLFRKCPFDGEFTVFAGLEECLRFISNFRFTEADLEYLRNEPFASTMEPGFFDYLSGLDCSQLKIFSQLEGSVVFPRVPLLRVEGPMMIVQLVETTLLTLVNYASLVATNAARHRLVAGDHAMLLEFGLRRAQGPDGGVSASRYAYLGGFDATSNLEAGRQFGIPCKGTHAHSYVQSHQGFQDIHDPRMKLLDGSTCPDFVSLVKEQMNILNGIKDSLPDDLRWSDTNQSELAAFTSYALAFPTNFLALVDTYDVIKSGMPNFLAVSLALVSVGYKPQGIRIDSGDLSYLSVRCRELMQHTQDLLGAKKAEGFGRLGITASNDIHEEVLHSLNQHGHAITAFGIGTHLVTCLRQPALGCVYKLVEIDGAPRIKLSEDVAKVTIPGRKEAYRLYLKNGEPVVDLMMQDSEPAPVAGERILCRHPFLESKRAFVSPARVERLYHVVWDGMDGGVPKDLNVDLLTARARCRASIKMMRPDHLRYHNPTPYKVSVSEQLHHFIHKLWLEEAPVREIV